METENATIRIANISDAVFVAAFDNYFPGDHGYEEFVRKVQSHIEEGQVYIVTDKNYPYPVGVHVFKKAESKIEWNCLFMENVINRDKIEEETTTAFLSFLSTKEKSNVYVDVLENDIRKTEILKRIGLVPTGRKKYSEGEKHPDIEYVWRYIREGS